MNQQKNQLDDQRIIAQARAREALSHLKSARDMGKKKLSVFCYRIYKTQRPGWQGRIIDLFKGEKAAINGNDEVADLIMKILESYGYKSKKIKTGQVMKVVVNLPRQ